MVASVEMQGVPRLPPIFIPTNGPLSGTDRTKERNRRCRNQILEFANGEQFQVWKSTLRSLPKKTTRVTTQLASLPPTLQSKCQKETRQTYVEEGF